jgi:hypothetical protein
MRLSFLHRYAVAEGTGNDDIGKNFLYVPFVASSNDDSISSTLIVMCHVHVIVWYYNGAYLSAVFGCARLRQRRYTRRTSSAAPVPSVFAHRRLLGSSGAGYLGSLSYPKHVSDSYQQAWQRLRRSMSWPAQWQILFPTPVTRDPGTRAKCRLSVKLNSLA